MSLSSSWRVKSVKIRSQSRLKVKEKRIMLRTSRRSLIRLKSSSSKITVIISIEMSMEKAMCSKIKSTALTTARKVRGTRISLLRDWISIKKESLQLTRILRNTKMFYHQLDFKSLKSVSYLQLPLHFQELFNKLQEKMENQRERSVKNRHRTAFTDSSAQNNLSNMFCSKIILWS